MLGICNGFQILLEAGLLPGAMLRNRDLKFHCEHVRCASSRPIRRSPRRAPRQVLRIADRARRRATTSPTRDDSPSLEASGRVIFRYCDAAAQVTDAANPNGSRNNIAGICNEARNVVGLMPHPERACEPRSAAAMAWCCSNRSSILARRAGVAAWAADGPVTGA